MAGSSSLQAHHSLAGVYDMKKDNELYRDGATVKFIQSPRVADDRGQECGWHETDWVMTLGSATALAHAGSAKPARTPSTPETPLP